MPATAKRPTSRKRPPRPAGKPGPQPAVLRGFTFNPPEGHRGHKRTKPLGPDWTKGSPAHTVLNALRAGASWAHAADIARLHESTPRTWNTRGRDLVAEADLDTFAADPRLDQESLAMACFHVLAREAIASPAVGYLAAITRAAATDWRAAVAGLRVLPQAAAYRETTRTEHTGAEGTPLVPDSTRIMLDLAEQFVDQEVAAGEEEATG